MKALLVVSPSMQRVSHAEQRRREASDQSPRLSLLEDTLNADVIDSLYFQSLAWPLRILYKLLPPALVLALEAYRRRLQYDVVVSWDDRFAILYPLLLLLTRSRARYVAILSWMAPPKKGLPLRLVQKHIDCMIVRSQNQKDLLIEFFGISPERIVEIPQFVDQQFWRPMESAIEGICSAGDSRRDYATLIEAMRGLPIQCRLATKVKPAEKRPGDWGATARAVASISDLPDNVILGPATPAELRAAYAGAFCVVVPLFPSFRDHGITTVVEAMAMGKAVICSRIFGQIDFLEDGKNGMFVPPGDPQALREAILYLYEHPEIARRMGAEGRRRAEQVFALDSFVENVRQIVEDVITGKQTHIPTMSEKLRSPQAAAASWATH